MSWGIPALGLLVAGALFLVRREWRKALPVVGETWLLRASGPWGKTYRVEILELRSGHVRYVQLTPEGKRMSTEDSNELSSFMRSWYRP